MVAWITATGGRDPLPFLTSPLIFLGFAVLARVLLPAVSLTPGCCARCDYDLLGSWEAGRCPECGSPIGKTLSAREVSSEPATENFLEKIWAWCVRHPLTALLVLTLGWTVNVEAIRVRRTWRAGPLVRALNSLSNETVIDLSALISFDWDTVFVYGPYATLAVPAGVNADSWKRMTENIPHGFVDDSEMLFVFIRHHDVVEHFPIRRWALVDTKIAGQALPREEARFDVDSGSRTGQWILTTPLYCIPSEANVH
jgi:hypothetical protein